MKLFVFLFGISMAYGQMYDRLYDNLMKEDHSGTIPRSSFKEPVVVKFGLSLVRVKSIDTSTGDADLDIWMQYNWRDTRLTWSRRKYNNITNIRVQPDRIWRPDIELYDGEMKSGNSLAVLYKNGDLTHIPKTRVNLRCDVSNYTIEDTVTCSMKFGSWTFNGQELDLKLQQKDIDTANYKTDRWSVESSSVERNVVHYPCCPEPYPDVTARIVFRDNRQNQWSFF